MTKYTIESPCELCQGAGKDAGRYDFRRECCWVRFLRPEVRRKSSQMRSWMESVRAMFSEEVTDKIRCELKKGVQQ